MPDLESGCGLICLSILARRAVGRPAAQLVDVEPYVMTIRREMALGRTLKVERNRDWLRQLHEDLFLQTVGIMLLFSN